MNNKNEILKKLFKDFDTKHTITSISNSIKMTRAGVWKSIKTIASEKFLTLTPIGNGKTSTYTVALNKDNPLVEKTLSILLTEEALKNQRWMSCFSDLEKNIGFLIIYGSIIDSPKEANDIDLIGIVSNKNKFKEIDIILSKMQKTQIKKIHALFFTEKEFRNELINNNKAFIDAVKKGIVLFGQENFVRFMKGVDYGR